MTSKDRIGGPELATLEYTWDVSEHNSFGKGIHPPNTELWTHVFSPQ